MGNPLFDDDDDVIVDPAPSFAVSTSASASASVSNSSSSSAFDVEFETCSGDASLSAARHGADLETTSDEYDDRNAAFASQGLDRPKSPVSVFDFPSIQWASVSGLDSNQITALEALATKGVKWKHALREEATVFTLHYGGLVEADGNCLFSSCQHALQLKGGAREVRKLAVKRFLEDYESGAINRQTMDSIIRNMYAPDLSSGWGIHIVQELKLVAKKSDREAIESSITDLVNCGLSRESAAECVFKEKCTFVNDGRSWAQYMSVSGCPSDEFYIVSLQYIEDGLLTVDENPFMNLAAFGDDIAIESIATEFCREIFVIQSHGSDAMISSGLPLFFLPHSPRGKLTSILHPMFLFMKGTGWSGAGADHYDPIVAKVANNVESSDQVAMVL